MRPLALDLFCCAGGAAMGLHRAGFDVVGVDNRPQPRYPFRFVVADALRPPFDLGAFDLVWASPPCQHYTRVWNGRDGERARYPDLVAATRALLIAHPRTVIENVPGAPMRPNLIITGATVGLPIIRKRLFELRGFLVPLLLSPPQVGTVAAGDLACVAGHGANSGWAKWADISAPVRERLLRRNDRAGWSDALGIDWMTRSELAQAIPPAYAEIIGRAALASLPANRPSMAAAA